MLLLGDGDIEDKKEPFDMEWEEPFLRGKSLPYKICYQCYTSFLSIFFLKPRLECARKSQNYRESSCGDEVQKGEKVLRLAGITFVNRTSTET